MKTKIKKTNLKRLASLSALGAGALGASAGPAQASSIVYSGILDEQVGFGGTRFNPTFAGPNGVGGIFKTGQCEVDCFYFPQWVALYAKPGVKGTTFRFLATKYQHYGVGFARGAQWQTSALHKSTKSADLAITSLNRYFTEFNSTDRYLLFEFTGGSLSHDLYGWAQLDVTFPGNFAGPYITLVDWAYDTSGAQIPAGDTGTPEPSTLVLTGLAALALGAKGLRSWRAARKALEAV
jgi:hypothetical protein